MSAIRSYRTVSSPVACLNARPQAEKKSIAPQQTRAASEHAIANPTLAGIEKRWEALPPQEQADLWMQLRDRMKVDWHQMTIQEKKAGMNFLITLRVKGYIRILPDIYHFASLLDRFRTSRTPFSTPQGRGFENLYQGRSALRCLCRRFLPHPRLR